MKSAVLLGFCALLGASAMAQSLPSAMPLQPVALAALDTAQASHAGIVKSVQGQVNRIAPNGETQAVKAGDPVRSADRLVSEVGGAASLVLRDGTTMVLGASSQLEVRQFRYDPTTQEGSLFVALMRGSMRMITGLIGKTHPEAVRIDTQTATIGIRGTDFIVLADAQP